MKKTVLAAVTLALGLVSASALADREYDRDHRPTKEYRARDAHRDSMSRVRTTRETKSHEVSARGAQKIMERINQRSCSADAECKSNTSMKQQALRASHGQKVSSISPRAAMAIMKIRNSMVVQVEGSIASTSDHQMKLDFLKMTLREEKNNGEPTAAEKMRAQRVVERAIAAACAKKSGCGAYN